ncbi:MAG TPA: matrixin family metalloprotease [Bryobacteraceae bacterium]|nr:matrixin family metalloprotease [Bryobacteraceae bacterium]
MLCLGLAQIAGAQGFIRLKGRTIDTRGHAPVRTRLVAHHHYILQFGSFPGAEVRGELARRGIQVLSYVPDDAVGISVSADADLNGLDVIWSGSLAPADKLSPGLELATPLAYVVVFYPDVVPAVARMLVRSAGLYVQPNVRMLPGQFLVTGDYSRVKKLAEADEVSYILPASADLISGAPVMACAGAMTEAGPVADYVLEGDGWPADSSGGVDVKYVFSSFTNKVDATSVESEVVRAFQEWAKYANVTFTAGTVASASQTISILFAAGPHGDPYPFDGPGGVLAHTFYPAPPNSEPTAGDMHLDASENWHIGKDVDVFSVALHEAGHALGLGHSDNPNAVMYPYYRLSTGLSSDDIAGIQKLYGSRGEPPATPAQPPATSPSQPSSQQPAQPSEPPVQPPAQPPSQPPSDADTTPPSMRIVSPGSTIAATLASSITIRGTAMDNVAVTSVNWTTSNGKSGAASGTSSWSATVPLLVGNNMVVIRAYDGAGNSSWRSLTIVRR